MHAIRHLATAEEPLVDKSRIEEPLNYGTQRRCSLAEDFDVITPTAKWTRAIYGAKGKRMPQTIAHRGYKAIYPENTMVAFEGAVDAGAHAIETDIHLTKDGIAVLSHDRDLKRCFGREEKIIDCDWQFLSQQKSLREPHGPMPRLLDLLQYLAQPQQQNIWLLLDIKIRNDANDVMRIISETLKAVDSGPRQWSQRVVLGIWAARYLPLCAQYLPGYAISHISFSSYHARQFLKVPNVSFNMLQKILLGPIGTSFIKDVKKADRPLIFWTVNESNMMKWSIQKQADGVITDDPKLFREICDNWQDREPIAKPTWSQWLYTFWLYILLTIFWIPIRRRFPETVDTFLSDRTARKNAMLKIR